MTTTQHEAPRRAPARSAADAIFATLRAWDVDRVFICPGSTEAAFLDASLAHPDVELVLTTHEAVTVSMADGYARITGRPAVAYVHTHLGLSNGLAHLSSASLAHSPVVVITGLKATSLHGAVAGFTTTSDVRALPRQFVKWAHETASTEAIATDLDHALHVAASAPAGPVFLGIAQDRMEADVAVPPAPARPDVALAPARPAPDAVAHAAELIARGRRPLVVAGAGVFNAGVTAVDALGTLARTAGAPVVVEDRRTIERAEPFGLDGYAGVLDGASDAVRSADLVLLAGARTPIRFEHTAPPVLPDGVPVVQLAEDAHTLQDLTAALDGAAPEAVAFRDDAVAAHRTRTAELRRGADDQAGAVPIRVPALMRRLCTALPDGTWVVDDSVTSQTALLDHALAYDANLRYLTTASGSLGWAMGAALGVAEARPGERVVAVLGDGVFQFGLPALWTAVDRRLSVTFVVVNNRGYGAVRAALRRFDGMAVARDTYPTTGLAGADLAAIARGFGGVGVRIERLDELADALTAAESAPNLAVIEVLTDPDDMGPR
jgi:benzoylformate decarboxylase